MPAAGSFANTKCLCCTRPGYSRCSVNTGGRNKREGSGSGLPAPDSTCDSSDAQPVLAWLVPRRKLVRGPAEACGDLSHLGPSTLSHSCIFSL